MSPNRLFSFTSVIWLAFLLICAGAILFANAVGAVGLWPDTLHTAFLARHMLETGQVGAGAGLETHTSPFYGIMMLAAFAPHDLMLGHSILLFAQCAIYATGLFPLVTLLLKNTQLQRYQALLLAVVLMMGPWAIAYAPMLTADMLVASFTLWLTLFLQKWIDNSGIKNAASIAFILSLLLLAHTLAPALWAAVALCVILSKPKAQEATIILGMPILIYGLWSLSISAPLELAFNNPLARFNLVKNGLLYLCYAGAPLAGLTLLICVLTQFKKTATDRFLLFCACATLFTLVLSAFTASVIVEKKLDYFMGRSLDPFLFFPCLFLFRMDDKNRRDILSNGLLVLTALFFFGYPHNLNLDFASALSYWAQGAPNAGMGMVRNIIFILFLSLPVSLLFWKPKAFIAVYVFVAFVLGGGSLFQNHAVWSKNEDGNMRFINVNGLLQHPDFKDKTVYTDFNCTPSSNNDVARLYRCFDTTKALYFLPNNPVFVKAEDVLTLKPEEQKEAIFISRKNDNLWGTTVAQIGLARFMRIEPDNKMEATPLINIEKIHGLKRYYNIPVAGKFERMAFLDDQTKLELYSSRDGCAVLEAPIRSAAKKAVIRFTYDEKPLKTIDLPASKPSVPVTLLQLEIPIKKGLSVLTWNIETQKEEGVPEGTPSLILFSRPIFRPCN